ncbi:hypothetical protein [Microbacterium sp.]|uniref:DUF6993 domain-containing protein n=1 Tax=Microbacterium sp. TaxID=51671 RepID=UPI0026118F90|nr:hypothetical protein [Microbacterium sp.]
MTRRPASIRERAVLMAAATAAIATMIVGCAPESGPTPEPSPSSDQTPVASPTPVEPSYHADGTAEDNLPLFTAVTQQVWASEAKGSSRAYIDALIAAGFDRADMQVTKDHSTVGNPAESLQFSVSWGEDHCLIGQVGPSTGDPVTAVMDQLPEGRCLIGNTEPIDW